MESGSRERPPVTKGTTTQFESWITHVIYPLLSLASSLLIERVSTNFSDLPTRDTTVTELVTYMEVPVSPKGCKRKDVSTSEVPAHKRSSSGGDGGKWSDITDWTDWSESDFSIPRTGDSPPSQKLPGQLEQYGAVHDQQQQRDEPESFYGLPMEMKTLLKKYRNIDELYEWQSRLMDRLMSCHTNVIYSVPTSGGKTLVAELMLIRELLVHKRNALLVLPYVSIVQEKLRSMYPFAEKLGFMIEEFAGSRGLLPLRMRRKMKYVVSSSLHDCRVVIEK